jgi:hypothetical protein
VPGSRREGFRVRKHGCSSNVMNQVGTFCKQGPLQLQLSCTCSAHATGLLQEGWLYVVHSPPAFHLYLPSTYHPTAASSWLQQHS